MGLPQWQSNQLTAKRPILPSQQKFFADPSPPTESFTTAHLFGGTTVCTVFSLLCRWLHMCKTCTLKWQAHTHTAATASHPEQQQVGPSPLQQQEASLPVSCLSWTDSPPSPVAPSGWPVALWSTSVHPLTCPTPHSCSPAGPGAGSGTCSQRHAGGRCSTPAGTWETRPHSGKTQTGPSSNLAPTGQYRRPRLEPGWGKEKGGGTDSEGGPRLSLALQQQTGQGTVIHLTI